MNNLINEPLTDSPTLPGLHLGAPSVVGPLTLFPIWTDAPVPRSAVKLGLPKGASISELESGPTVELLTATNPTTTPFALLEGTVVDGGWQHRVLVHSMLVPGETQIDVPVRCVEQGRWNGGERQRVSRLRAPLGIRGANRGIRADRPGRDGVADQGDVWSRVSAYEQRHGASATSSMVEVLDQVQLPQDLVGSVPEPLYGQRGALIGVAGHPALVEVFEHPRSFARQWGALVDGLLRSTTHVRPVQTPGYRARAFVERLTRRALPAVAEAGAGIRAEDGDDLVSIGALNTQDGRLVHGAALNVRHDLVLAA